MCQIDLARVVASTGLFELYDAKYTLLTLANTLARQAVKLTDAVRKKTVSRKLKVE